MKHAQLTIFLFLVSLLLGCSSVSRSINETKVNSKLKENGIYYRESISDDAKYKYITKFRLNKKEKKLTYAFQKFDMQGSLLEDNSFEKSYYLSCSKSGCKIGYSRRFNKGIASYVIRLDDDGIPYIYESGNIYKFDFIPD
jgi:hypothetical protein